MLERFNKEDLLKLASKAKVASQMPPKAVVAPTSSEEDEDTASGFIFTRKRGRNRAISPVPSSSQGQTTLSVAPPQQPSNVPPATPCYLEGGAKSSRRKCLWDTDIDITSYLEDSLLRSEDEERMVVHGGHHLL